MNVMTKSIRDTFSNASLQYDVLSSLHREIGRELSESFKDLKEVSAILDVGCGTGWFTKRLKNFFPNANVIGMDFASGMIERASQQDSDFNLIQADADKIPFRRDSFDLITSNLAFQWMNDLSAVFSSCSDLLKEDGALRLTMFGQQTFHELFEALDECRSVTNEQNRISRLPSLDLIETSLNQSSLNVSEVKSELIKVRFTDLMSLLQWTKGIGANSLRRDFFVGPDLLARTNTLYNQRFCDHLGVYATFEVIWIKAKKN